MVSNNANPTQVFVLLIKRLIDITFALLAFALTFPLTLVAALVLWILHGENPIFKQIRVGKNYREFTILKLKTESDKRNYQNSAFIKAIRETHIDELPQLVNIIAGSMSIVGPRPHIPEHVATYEYWQQKRLSVKPGLTCLRQLKSPYKKIHFNELIEYDVSYAENWTLLLDLKIMAKTLAAIFHLLPRH